MSIKVANPQSSPALVYDRVFLHDLSLRQQMSTDDNRPPVYDLHIMYRMYALDGDERHFSNKVDTIIITDYLNLALVRAAEGNMDLVNAMGAIEIAFSKILEDQTNLGTTEVL